MKNITIFEESDYELLKKGLPADPCTSCGQTRHGCCGCKKAFDYEKEAKEFKEAGVYELALKIRMLNENNNKLRIIKRDNEKLIKEIKDSGADISQLSIGLVGDLQQLHSF